MSPNMEDSARILAGRIRDQAPTAFFRFGDGLIECLHRKPGKDGTCDGERYDPNLAAALSRMAGDLFSVPDIFIGDWAPDPDTTTYLDEWSKLTNGIKAKLLHFEALLIVRESNELVDFYRAVKEDPRRKLFMGPTWNTGAAVMLGAQHFVIPNCNLFAHIDHIESRLKVRDFDVLLFGAGMAGNLPVANCWKERPDRTYINLGSAMDPLFKGRTRTNQLPPERARALFAELL